MTKSWHRIGPGRRNFWRLSLLALLLLRALPCWAEGFTDDDGQPVEVSRPFTRLISLYGAHTENLLHLGLDKEIVGIGRGDRGLPGLADRPVFSLRDDPERLLALRPDLVLIRPMISRGYPRLVERLRLSGVAVVSLQPTSMNELFDYWQRLGRLTGREARAEAMVAAFERERGELIAKVVSIPAGERPRVYFEAIHARMKTFAPSSMAIFALETAGGVNVAADAIGLRNTNIALYGKERILARAGEIEVFLAQQGRMNPVELADIVEEPGFQVIRALREGRVYLVDEEIVSRPTPNLIKGAARIQEILYPEALRGKGGE